jgi:hypothetical protein
MGKSSGEDVELDPLPFRTGSGTEPLPQIVIRRRALTSEKILASPMSPMSSTPWAPSPPTSSFISKDETDYFGRSTTALISRETLQSLPDSKPNRKAIQHAWTLEYGAMVLAILTGIALILLLAFADGKPMDRFDTIFFSFNTVVSILAAIIHAALAYTIGSCLAQEKWNWYKSRPDSLAGFERFEQASRGPWGSLWLVLWINIRHWAVLGGLVTIIMLGFEPLLQAVVSFRGELDDSGLNLAPALLGWTKKIDSGVYTDYGGAQAFVGLPDGTYMVMTTFQSQADMGMVSSLYNGFNTVDVGFQTSTSYTCPTGNCTWSPFTTLGVCSKCQDVSSHLVKTTVNGTNLGTVTNPVMYSYGNFTSYSLPYVNLTNFDTSVRYGTEAYMSAAPVLNPGLTIAFQDMDTMISTVGIITAAKAYESGDTDWNETTVSATECALYYCANAYQSRVQNSVLEETTLGSWAERIADSFLPDVNWDGNRTKLDVYNSYTNNSLVFSDASGPVSGADIHRSDLQLQIPATVIEQLHLPANTTLIFNVSQQTIGSMYNYINEQFFSSPYKATLVWPEAGTQGFAQPPVAQALYQSGNLSATFDRAALCLSNWMRSYDNTTQTGAQQQWVTHIEVIWEYVIFPALTFLGGCVFVVLAIWETRQLNLSPWKDDVIAMLTHSLDDEMMDRLRDAERQGKTWKLAKSLIVEFGDWGRGWELKAKES